MQSQMTRPYGHEQAEDPIRIHHPEEEEHHEKGVLKKVKEKAKKIKNSLTKHGDEHGHDVDEEDDEYDEQSPELHGAPVYESSAVRGGVTGQQETNVPAPEEIIPPGTKVFPVVSSDYTKPIEPEPLQDVTSGHEALSHPLRVSDLSDREESREAHYVSLNTPMSLLSATEDVTRTFAPGEEEYLGGQRKVNMERPKGLEEDPAAPGGGSDYLSGVSNYQSKVTDPTQQGGGEAGIPRIVESLGRMKVTDDSPDQKSRLGLERDSPARSHELAQKNKSGNRNSPTGLESASITGLGEDFLARSHEFDQKTESGIEKNSPTGSHGYGEEAGPGLEKDLPARNDDVKVETVLGRDLPTGSHDQFSTELSRPKERDDFDSKDEKHETKPSMIGSATSAITGKAIAAKNAVVSKLGYSSGEKHESPGVDETPRSATGYGQKVAGTVAEKLTPVYEKVKETGATMMTKLPISGGGSRTEETQQVEDKGASPRGYLADKLRPGEEDKALSDVIAEKLHLGGGEKKKTTTKEVEVTVEKIPSDEIPKESEHCEAVAEEGKGGGGMVGKVKGAVTSWIGGTKVEVKPKSPDSVEDSSQSLGSTVGTKGFTDSGGSGLVETGGGGGAEPLQKGL